MTTNYGFNSGIFAELKKFRFVYSKKIIYYDVYSDLTICLNFYFILFFILSVFFLIFVGNLRNFTLILWKICNYLKDKNVGFWRETRKKTEVENEFKGKIEG